MIKNFRYKSLHRLFETNNAPDIQAGYAKRLRLQLSALDTAQAIEDMYIPGSRLHHLKCEVKRVRPITANGNWRITYEFEDRNAYALSYEDYHR